ncbi:OmpW/AlkL family protein [Tenacibaculum maritimum]|uniref:OmpW/AlkL family protein n=1 Tax=Tenacibaculum maritimum TaxID=107401 RepID=UPI0038765C2F
MKKVLISFVLGILFLGNANAQEKVKDCDFKRWQARCRWVTVIPNESAKIGAIGGDAAISTNVIPEVDFTYFFTKNISTELVLGTTKHSVSAVQTALGNVNLGHVWLLPPTLTVQYHFNINNFKPYLGAGGNYTIFYSSNPGAVIDVAYKNAFGYAFQLGFDYDLNDKWFLNIDAKYVGLNTDVTVKTLAATVPADIDINPLLIGFGVGLKF